MDNEKRISNILNSLEGMQKAEPSPNLYAKIQTRLNSLSVNTISIKWTYASLSALTILLLINLFLFNYENGINQKSEDSNEFISFQQEMNSDQLY